MILCHNPPPSILAQALGFSRAEVRGCELLRVQTAWWLAQRASCTPGRLALTRGMV